MKALILIGGMGTRLRPLTCSTPKPLLPIVNKPFLEYQIELLKRHGITDIVLCVSHLSQAFKSHFGSGKKWGVSIRYVHDRTPLGTGGAIRNAAGQFTETTLIFNGDILSDIDLTRFIAYHHAKKACVTIALARVKDPTAYGLITTTKAGRITQFLEKPSRDEVTCDTINAGIYLFEPSMFGHIPAGVNYSVERGLFPALLKKDMPLYGYASPSYWMDIGTVEKYMQAHADVMLRRVRVGTQQPLRVRRAAAAPVVVRGMKTRVDPTAMFNGTVSLGNCVTVGPGTVITNSVVLDGTRIAEGARLENVCVGRDCRIEAYAVLGPGTALGDRTVITQYSKIANE